MSDFIHKTQFTIERSIHDPLRNTNDNYALYDGYELPNVAKKYWKWDDGLNKVIEMIQDEKDEYDDAVAANTPEPVSVYKTKNQIIHEIYESFNPILADVFYYSDTANDDYELILDTGWVEDDVSDYSDQMNWEEFIRISPDATKVYKIYTARKDTQDELDAKHALKIRMIMALNKYPAFITMLDGDGTGPNYELALEILALIHADDSLEFNDDDYNLVSGIVCVPI